MWPEVLKMPVPGCAADKALLKYRNIRKQVEHRPNGLHRISVYEFWNHPLLVALHPLCAPWSAEVFLVPGLHFYPL